MLSEKIDVLQLAFYTAPVSSCVLLPFFWFLEVRPRPSTCITEAGQTLNSWLRGLYAPNIKHTSQLSTKHPNLSLSNGKARQRPVSLQPS